MLGMVEAVSAMKRTLAMAIPLCLLWAMVGCVLICASEIEDTFHQDDSSLSVHRVVNPHEDDCCPIIASTIVRPERFLIDTGNAPTHTPAFAFENNTLSARTQANTFTPAFSPPFARLCTLRI